MKFDWNEIDEFFEVFDFNPVIASSLDISNMTYSNFLETEKIRSFGNFILHMENSMNWRALLLKT